MLIHTRCPIDGTDDADEELYPANFDLDQVTPDIFSARRMPDRMHYRMVRNKRTGCVRADPILDQESVVALYERSKVNLESLAAATTKTYAHYLKRALPHLPDRRGAIEVGCASGLFLVHLMKHDFENISGIELSADAIEKADDRVRPHIVASPLQPGLFPASSFSLACGFQVLDHLVQPNEVLGACYDLLAPGGVAYWICHDIGSPLARLLGERCPMVDIEHVVLYDRRTIAQLFRNNGFDVIEVFGVRNRYPLSYWLHLAPVPFKAFLRRAIEATGLANWQLTANLGNMGIVARKPLS